MTRRGFGSITKLGRGHYRVRWTEHVGGEAVKRSQNVRGTRADAEAALDAAKRGEAPHPKRSRRRASGMRDMTVGEAYERWWLPAARARLDAGEIAKNTWNSMGTTWRLRVSRWADVRCRDVRPVDIQEWLDPMTQKPAVDALAMLRQILDYAALYEVVEVNKARREYVMPKRHRDGRDGAYTLAELDRIAQAARGSCAEAAMLLSMFGSCRTGESLGVRVPEVSRAEACGLSLTVAQVVRQVVTGSDVSPDGVLKNRQSVRPVVVPPPWGDRLWELAGAARSRGEAWLCDDGCGRPLSQAVLRREWAAATAAAGVEPRQPRAARRSWETFMRWDMGIDRSKVEQMMGHALPGVTGEHYDRPTERMFVEAVAEAFARRPFVRT